MKIGKTQSLFFVIQVLPTSLNNDDLFWRTYTLFNSKDVKIEKSRLYLKPVWDVKTLFYNKNFERIL